MSQVKISFDIDLPEENKERILNKIQQAITEIVRMELEDFPGFKVIKETFELKEK